MCVGGGVNRLYQHALFLDHGDKTRVQLADASTAAMINSQTSTSTESKVLIFVRSINDSCW